MSCTGTWTLLITLGLFYFSEGKACPEKIRPHKSRCEMYYKCMDLPTQNHVWVPEKCEKGLVYVDNLQMCALPGDDWECNLGEVTENLVDGGLSDDHDKKETRDKNTNNDADIYIIANNDEDSSVAEKFDDDQVEVVLKSNLSSEEETENDDENSQYESSGDGSELIEEFLQAANRETTDRLPETSTNAHKETHENPSRIDPNLTAQLQRLSQLIDGLKQTYQGQGADEKTELRPDQLNAFLAHFNIKNGFDSIDPTDEMHGNYKSTALPTRATTTTSIPTPTPIYFGNTSQEIEIPSPSLNKTNLQHHLSINKLQPETKVVLTSSLPKLYGSNGFSNSQIVVNRPEGSVLFSLPPYGNNDDNFVQHVMPYQQNSPKISEETLKTVLELSKQMIANQNVPKVIPNPAFYAQPIIQPLYLPPNPFGGYFSSNNNNNNYNGAYIDNGHSYEKPSPITNHHKPHYGHKNPHRPQISYSGKPGTTIIHNNVIPVHVTSTNSGEKEVVDSYGQSLGLYPPLYGNSNNNNNDYTFQVTHQYENNKFVTTMRPVTSTTQPNHYTAGQYPSPYPTDNSVTTARPPLHYQPSPSTIQEYYTPSPHLSENNANSLFRPPDYGTTQLGSIPRPMGINRPDPNYQQQLERPTSYYHTPNQNSLFPTQIDPSKVQIYPNSEKTESMETESDDDDDSQAQSPFSIYANNKDKKPQIQSSQYGQTSSSIFGNAFGQKHPYLPRPSQQLPSSSSGYGNNLLGHSGSLGVNKPNYNAQLVNIGGNFISYDAFQNSILPLIEQSPTGNYNGDLNGNIEVITCQPGVRQANMTDCTRYYVCSKKDGKVLSYYCPRYTAFNAETRICDARTYAICAPNAIISSYTVSENKRIQMEAIQALNDAKRRRDQANKAQSIAALLQQYQGQLNSQPLSGIHNGISVGSDKDVLNSYVQQAAAISASAVSITSTTVKPAKKRKYYCKEGDKVPDQTSIHNYFVCYKNAQGMMKGLKMSCSKGLLFCPMTRMCTLTTKCTSES